MSAKVKVALAATLFLAVGASVWVATVPPSPAPPPSAPVSVVAGIGASDAGPAGGGGAAVKRAAAEPARRTVAERTTIEGRVTRPDGTPALGIYVLCRFTEGFPVRHPRTYSVSGPDGSFRFPAVAGAPYGVGIEASQLGIGRIGGTEFVKVCGGATNVALSAAAGTRWASPSSRRRSR